jgi:hypothetical protein
VTPPVPFHDEDGFPIVLLRARELAWARGGDIVGSGDSWRVTHPHADIPDFTVTFFADGVAGVYFDTHSGIDNGPDKSYEMNSTGLTHIERLVVAVIDGGYRETIGYDELGDEISADSAIESADVTDVGGYGFDQVPVREETYRYPRWPVSGRV